MLFSRVDNNYEGRVCDSGHRKVSTNQIIHTKRANFREDISFSLGQTKLSIIMGVHIKWVSLHCSSTVSFV